MAREIRVALVLDDRDFRRKLRANEQQLKSFGTAGGGAGRSAAALGGAVTGLSRVLGPLGISLTAATAAISGFTASVASTGIEFENLIATLAITTGSLESARDAFSDIQDLAASTQFSVQTITTAFTRLLNVGVEPTNELLQTLSNIAATTTDELGTFQALLDLITRTTEGGLGLEDINRLIDRGIPVFKLLNEELGLSKDQITEFGRSSEGAREIIDTLLRTLGGTASAAAELRSETLGQKLNNLNDAFNNFQFAVFENSGLGAILKSITDFSTRKLDELTDGLNDVNQAAQEIQNIDFENLQQVSDEVNQRIAPVSEQLAAVNARIRELQNQPMPAEGMARAALNRTLRSLKAQAVELAKQAGDIGSAGVNAVVDVIAATNKAQETAADVSEDTAETVTRRAELLAESVQRIVDSQKSQAQVLQETLDELTQARELGLDISGLDLAIETVRRRIQALRAETEDAQFMANLSPEALDALQSLPRILEDARTPLQDLQRDVDGFTELFNKGAISSEEFATALQQLADTYSLDEQENPIKQLRADLEALPENFQGLTRGIELLDEALASGLINQESYNELLRQLREELPANAEAIESFRQSLEGATRTLSQSLAEGLVEGKLELSAFKDFVKTLITDIIKEIIRLQIIQPLISGIFGAQFGAGGAITGFGGGGLFGDLFGGARRLGGPVQKNVPYLVGEMGPELFTPPGAGNIVPNNQLRGQPTQVNYNIQAVDARSFKQLVAQDPEFLYSVTQAGARRLPG